MATVTIMSDEVRVADATTTADRILVEPDRLPQALGWTLKPEGLCRDEVCVPVGNVDELCVEDKLDLAAVAAALGRAVVIDTEASLAAVALPAEQRRLAVDGLQAPDFTLDDLDGTSHRLAEWRNQKKLLVAFATW